MYTHAAFNIQQAIASKVEEWEICNLKCTRAVPFPYLRMEGGLSLVPHAEDIPRAKVARDNAPQVYKNKDAYFGRSLYNRGRLFDDSNR